MSEYLAPMRDMQFVLSELVDLEAIARLPGHEEISPDLVAAILNEAQRFSSEVISPLNRVGDEHGARWQDGEVITPAGWRAAYDQFVESGWNALSCPTEHGGQGLPRLVSTLVEEMWNGANVAFALCSMLTRGAVEALEIAGSDELKQAYLPKLISGEWTGTMNLTEPQAGSDLSAVRTRAVPQDNGSYKVHGQKIFITYGEHDLTDNIIHMVLARTPDAPAGVKGISLFVVPKYLVNEDGSLGARNDVHCLSIEDKLGIHASPTAVLAFGDKGGEGLDGPGAVGYLVGEENRGLEYMFIMMNAARFAVGLEGVGLAERAYQRALAYAKERVQGTEAGVKGGDKVAILRHPDVRRMLMLMKSQTEAMRALACVVAEATDIALAHADAAERAGAQAFVDLMIPVVKGWSTENSVDIASLGVQIHGGMGFIEETGAAQHLRDARITPIYEGTTGIQANDLVGRKIARDDGKAIGALIERMRSAQQELQAQDDPELQAVGAALQAGVTALEETVAFILAEYGQRVARVLVGAVPFLELLGVVAGGWQMGRAALAAQRRLAEGEGDAAFYRSKITTARFYADHVLAQAATLAITIVNGADAALTMADDQF